MQLEGHDHVLLSMPVNKCKGNIFRAEKSVCFPFAETHVPQQRLLILGMEEPVLLGTRYKSSQPLANKISGHKKALGWKGLEQGEEIRWEAQLLSQLPGSLNLMVSNNSCKTS